MKPFFIALFASVCFLHAGTANTVTPNKDAVIESKSVDYSFKTREAVYQGNVHVLVPVVEHDIELELNCQLLAAKFQTNGSSIETVTASSYGSNVVVLVRERSGTTYTNLSQKAVYTYQADGASTNRTLVLTGSPVVIQWDKNTSTADSITWDLAREGIRGENLRGMIPDFKGFQKALKREPTEVVPVAPSPAPQSSNP